MFNRILVAVLFGLFGGSVATRAVADDGHKQQFLAEFGVSKEIAKAYETGFRSEAEINLTPNQPTRKYMLAKCKSNMHGYTMEVYRIRTVTKDGSTEVPYGLTELGNSRYNAMITIEGERSLINSINVYDAPLARSSGLLCTGMLDLHSHRKFDELASSPTTSIEAFENSEILGYSYKMIRARFPIKLNGQKETEACNDYLFDERWLCRFVRTRTTSTIRISRYDETEVIYHSDAPLEAFPRAITIHAVDEEKKLRTLTREYRITDVSTQQVADDELTLTAYGFPEPAGVKWEKPTPRYIWWMLGVGVCAVVSLSCRLAVRWFSRAARPPLA